MPSIKISTTKSEITQTDAKSWKHVLIQLSFSAPSFFKVSNIDTEKESEKVETKVTLQDQVIKRIVYKTPSFVLGVCFEWNIFFLSVQWKSNAEEINAVLSFWVCR